MFELPKKLLCAVEAVLYIAYNGGQAPISSKEIADKQNLPPRYLEQLMQKLVRAGLLRGVRGPRGGYLLARERRRVTIGDICDVLQEDEPAVEQTIGTRLGQATLAPLVEKSRAEAYAGIAQVSMADLCDAAARERIARKGEERMDFTI